MGLSGTKGPGSVHHYALPVQDEESVTGMAHTDPTHVVLVMLVSKKGVQIGPVRTTKPNPTWFENENVYTADTNPYLSVVYTSSTNLTGSIM